MKLNPDCIRDLLLTVEEYEDIYYPEKYNLLDKYDTKEVMYHIKQCHLSGLLNKVTIYVDGECAINDLSPKGHELISKIQNKSNWTDILKKLGEAGSSIKAIIEFANTIRNL